MKSYIMNFNGRVGQSSKKNFQLIKENNCIFIYLLKIIFLLNELVNEIILQFGKINEETYIMDFQYPLSIFQAFAICISSLASKNICE